MEPTRPIVHTIVSPRHAAHLQPRRTLVYSMERLRRIRWPFAVILVICVRMSSVAQQPVAPTEIGWLGLFNGDLVEWLENENRLQSLCANLSQTADEYLCRDQKLAPKVHVVRLWAGPSENTVPAGSLLVIATPGKGLRALFVLARGGAATEFRPDLFDGDWGYGPYFHVTFLERRATWFRLPEGPFPNGTWLNATDFGGEPEVRLLEAQEIVSSPFGDLFVLGIDRGVLRARLEQEADMWCEPSERPPLRPWQEIRIAVSDLYTATGHLRVHEKYTRGC